MDSILMNQSASSLQRQNGLERQQQQRKLGPLEYQLIGGNKPEADDDDDNDELHQAVKKAHLKHTPRFGR